MKKLALFSILMMIFATGAVFACDGPCDKDKGDQAFTVDAQYLCGGSGCTKPKPAPKPEPEPDPKLDKDSEAVCGGDKGDKPAPEPDAMCGGSGCGRDKKEIKT